MAVGGIPCNTFHAPVIFEHFLHYMENIGPKIQILNMIDETVKDVLGKNSSIRKVGLLSTTGTRNTGVYADLLENKGIELIQVPIDMQEELHDSIYNKEWGIKATIPVNSHAKENFERYADYLIEMEKGFLIIL